MTQGPTTKTPGVDRMLVGGLALGFAFIAWHGLRYELGMFGKGVLFVAMALGAVQLFRGIWAWKYADREASTRQNAKQNLLVDVPLIGGNRAMLYAIEDVLVRLIETKDSLDIEMQSIDWANDMGTIHLTGNDADAMYANVFSTIARLAGPDLVLFPRPGMPIDTEINGKRLLVGLPGRKVM